MTTNKEPSEIEIGDKVKVKNDVLWYKQVCPHCDTVPPHNKGKGVHYISRNMGMDLSARGVNMDCSDCGFPLPIIRQTDEAKNLDEWGYNGDTAVVKVIDNE